MEEFAVMEAWSEYGSEDELVRELLDDDSPFFVLTESRTESEITPSNGEAINKLISTPYSGPTIDDFESALSATAPKDLIQDVSPSRSSMLERGSNKIEHKYTLKIKSCGNMIADDGYKWRKYGQKSIKNSPNPRCTNPRCSAKKQVERSSEDADTLVITYEGLHLHFAYPYFFMGQAHQDQPTQVKKPKMNSGEFQELHQVITSTAPDLPRGTFDGHNKITEEEEGMGPQGLLEDMVPLMIRNPSRTKKGYSSPTSPSPLLRLDIKRTKSEGAPLQKEKTKPGATPQTAASCWKRDSSRFQDYIRKWEPSLLFCVNSPPPANPSPSPH